MLSPRASLTILGAYDQCDIKELHRYTPRFVDPRVRINELTPLMLFRFVLSCANGNIGGFAKLNTMTKYPDPLHTYMSHAGLAIASHSGKSCAVSMVEFMSCY